MAEAVGKVADACADSAVVADEDALACQKYIQTELGDGAFGGDDESIVDSLTETTEFGTFQVTGLKAKLANAGASIIVPKDFNPKVGAKLTDDLIIHKRLAGGWQGSIFEMADAKGNVRPDIVLKVLKPGVLLGDLEKEWAIGQALNVLQRPDGYLPGFMKTLEAVRLDNKQRTFRGMLLERLNGSTAENVVKEHNFRDIEYVRDMCYQVFRAMDVAYTILGFHHTDLRLPNVMEHYPDPSDRSKREFKIIDYGLAYIERRKGNSLFAVLTKAIFKRVKSPSALAKTFASTVNPVNYLKAGVSVGYRAFWAGRLDVYHYLTSLSQPLDGRVWAMSDKQSVEDFIALMEKVTSVDIHAYFAEEDEQGNLIMPKAGFLGKLLFRKDKAIAYSLHLTKLQLQALPGLDNHGRMSPEKALEFPFFKPCIDHEALAAGPEIQKKLQKENVPVWRAQWWTPNNAVSSFSSTTKQAAAVREAMSTSSMASSHSVTASAP